MSKRKTPESEKKHDIQTLIVHPGWIQLKSYILQEVKELEEKILDPNNGYTMEQKSHLIENREFAKWMAELPEKILASPKPKEPVDPKFDPYDVTEKTK
jgi:hypothetical protein